MRKAHILFCIGLLAVFAASSTHFAAASDAPSPSVSSAQLSLDQVVDSLVRRNAERAEALHSAEATRIYHLAYRGFPGDREAEMTVRAVYSSPATKEFEVISQNGSKVILDRVFKKLLESEKEAAAPEVRDRTLMNRDNYEFALAGYESSGEGNQYVLQVNPKSKSKFVYRGKIWVDADAFAITRIEAEPGQNPSFWTKKSEIRHEYVRVQGFWVPARNQSVSYIRLGGRATLTIEYKDYRINNSPEPQAVSVSAAISQ